MINTFGNAGAQTAAPFRFDNALSSPFQSAFGGQQNGQAAAPQPQSNPLMQGLSAYHSRPMPSFMPQNFGQAPSGNPFGVMQPNASAAMQPNPLVNRLSYGAMTGSWNTPGYDPATNYYSQYQAQQAGPLPGILGAATPLSGGQ